MKVKKKTPTLHLSSFSQIFSMANRTLPWLETWRGKCLKGHPEKNLISGTVIRVPLCQKEFTGGKCPLFNSPPCPPVFCPANIAKSSIL